MATYLEKVKERIFPLSVGKELQAVFKEWFFTEQTIDHGVNDQECQLCGHNNIRYHFEIENSHTHYKLWVGSSCILKFDLSVYDGGRRLTKEEARRKLNQLQKEMRHNSCMQALERVKITERNPILENALEYYRDKKFFTPKLLNVVMWQLGKHKIDHDPSFFKLTLRKKWHKDDLRQLQAFQIHQMWPAMSSQQRNMAIRMGHTPPTENKPTSKIKEKTKNTKKSKSKSKTLAPKIKKKKSLRNTIQPN